jgi:hypothetical protein
MVNSKGDEVIVLQIPIASVLSIIEAVWFQFVEPS